MSERQGLKYIWRTQPRAPQQLFDTVKDVHPAMVQVMYTRGLAQSDLCEDFLAGVCRDPDDPELLQDVPRRLASGARSAYAFAAFVLASPLGLLLALLPKPVYAFYEHAQPRVFDLSPLADQEIAGVTMASEQALVLFVVFLYWFMRFLAEET